MVFRRMLIESLNLEDRIETNDNLLEMMAKYTRFVLVGRFQ